MTRGDPTQQPAEAKSARGGTSGGRLARVLSRALIGLVVIAAALFGVGFVEFAGEVSDTRKSALPAKAEGIVVFTGGQDRVSVAIKLLDGGYAKRDKVWFYFGYRDRVNDNGVLDCLKPDGTQLAFPAYRRGSGHRWFLLDLATGALRHSGEAPRCEQLTWCGEALIAADLDRKGVWICDTEHPASGPRLVAR